MREKIKSAIEEIKNDILKFSPNPEKVRLVAVTKYSEIEDILEAYNCGVFLYGENKAQLMRDKHEKLRDYDKIKWHFIGNLQGNKVKYIVDYVDMIHSINRLSIAKEIDRQCGLKNRKIDVLLECNVSGETSKEGYIISDLMKEIEELKKLKNINIVGLMTMAPFKDNENDIRSVFSSLRKLKDELNEKYFNNTLIELSMGMTNDYKIALEEGATIIRVGSKIFK